MICLSVLVGRESNPRPFFYRAECSTSLHGRQNVQVWLSSDPCTHPRMFFSSPPFLFSHFQLTFSISFFLFSHSKFFLSFSLSPFQISFFSTSPELSNKQRFEYFSRTIPSDHYQTMAMVKIVEQLNWKYISIIYEESNYGIKVIFQFHLFYFDAYERSYSL